MLTSLKILLASAIDYAGLFPPAKLSLEQAITAYLQAQTAPDQWILNRFVLPATQLNEFTKLRSNSFGQSLSLILSEDLAVNPEQLHLLCTTNPAITALEFSPLPPATIRRLLPDLPAGVTTFFEIPLGESAVYLSLLQGTKAFAKVRTGGITAKAFPTSSQLAQFIAACVAAEVPFKATAGLHHPLSGHYRLSYEPNSAFAQMHGFLNVMLLAAFLYGQKVTPEEAIAMLEEASLDGFQFTEERISWRRHDLHLAEIKKARQFFWGFGSCSFQEPINDLKTLKLL